MLTEYEDANVIEDNIKILLCEKYYFTSKDIKGHIRSTLGSKYIYCYLLVLNLILLKLSKIATII